MRRWLMILAAMPLLACVHAVAPTVLPWHNEHRLGATGRPFSPVNLAYGNGLTVYVDEQNGTGCASDQNSGFSATCGTAGVGPIATMSELMTRWGTLFPAYNQDSEIQILSDGKAGDPLMVRPWLMPEAPGVNQNSVTLYIDGPVTVSSSSTLGTVTAKNRSTNVDLSAISVGGACATGCLLRNNTHPSVAWTKRTGGGTHLSQPMVAMPLPIAHGGSLSGNTTPVDTWATSDAIDVITPFPKLFLTDLKPINAGVGSNGMVQIAHVNIAQDSTVVSAGEDPVYQYPNVQIAESLVTVYLVAQAGLLNTHDNSGLFNVMMLGGFGGGQMVAPYNNGAGVFQIAAGASWSSTNTAAGYAYSGVAMTFDHDIKSSGAGSQVGAFFGYNQIGNIEIESANTVRCVFGVLDMTASGPAPAGIQGVPGLIWGSGSAKFDAGDCQVYIPTGATTAATAFPIAGGLQINAQTLACLARPGDSAIGACNKTISAANIDTDVSTAVGCYAVFGGGSICKMAL